GKGRGRRRGDACRVRRRERAWRGPLDFSCRQPRCPPRRGLAPADSSHDSMMQFVSTRQQAPPVSFRDALFAGLAPDGGLYVPDSLPTIDFGDLRDASFVEVGTAIAARFVGRDIARPDLERLLADAL